MEWLECVLCDKTFPVDIFNVLCDNCRAPLLYGSDLPEKALHREKRHPLDMCIDFLPIETVDPGLDIGLTQTPLLELSRLGESLGLPPVYAKLENMQPTGSFKDRGTAVAVQMARRLGLNRIGTVSTGNMAASTAAFGARGGFQTYILVKEDTGEEKLLSTGVFGASVFKTRGDYGELFRKSLDIGRRKGIYFMNSTDPFRIEGYKTLSFELFLQFDERPPDFIFVPVSAGGHMIGLIKAFEELEERNLIKSIPAFVGVQAAGCSPVYQAFSRGDEKVSRIERTETIAHAISNPDPPGGDIVLKKLRRHGGSMLRVSDEEILHAQGLLAEKEGIFCLPASAATLAGMIRFAAENRLDPSSRVRSVLVLTGTGLKGLQRLEISSMEIIGTTLDGLESSLDHRE